MISAGKTAIERTILFSIAAAYIVHQLTRLDMLIPLIGTLVFVVIGLQLPKLKGLTLWLTSAFIVVGAFLMWTQKQGAWAWFEAAGINVTLVTLFLFAPLFGIPVRIPDYVEGLKRFYEHKLRSKTGLFTGTQLLTQIMGVFINVGSIPVVYEMVFVKPQRGMSLLLAKAMNRGFAGALFWSPYFAAMAIVTSSLALPWSSILPYSLGLAVISLIVCWAAESRKLSQAEAEPLQQEPEAQQKKAAFPYELGLYLMAAILVILALELTVQLPMVMLICMAAVLLPLIWCVRKKAMNVYRQGLKDHVTVTLPALQKEITLFLAAGFFSGAIGTTGFGSAVPALLGQIPLPVPVTFTLFAVALIVGSSFIGLHAIVPVTILANGIDPLDVQISPVYFAVLLLGSWGLSNPISPSSAVTNLLAGLFKRPVLDMASMNYKFTGYMLIALFFYLMVVGAIAPVSAG